MVERKEHRAGQPLSATQCQREMAHMRKAINDKKRRVTHARKAYDARKKAEEKARREQEAREEQEREERERERLRREQSASSNRGTTGPQRGRESLPRAASTRSRRIIEVPGRGERVYGNARLSSEHGSQAGNDAPPDTTPLLMRGRRQVVPQPRAQRPQANPVSALMNNLIVPADDANQVELLNAMITNQIIMAQQNTYLYAEIDRIRKVNV